MRGKGGHLIRIGPSPGTGTGGWSRRLEKGRARALERHSQFSWLDGIIFVAFSCRPHFTAFPVLTDFDECLPVETWVLSGATKATWKITFQLCEVRFAISIQMALSCSESRCRMTLVILYHEDLGGLAAETSGTRGNFLDLHSTLNSFFAS